MSEIYDSKLDIQKDEFFLFQKVTKLTMHFKGALDSICFLQRFQKMIQIMKKIYITAHINVEKK